MTCDRCGWPKLPGCACAACDARPDLARGAALDAIAELVGVHRELTPEQCDRLALARRRGGG